VIAFNKLDAYSPFKLLNAAKLTTNLPWIKSAHPGVQGEAHRDLLPDAQKI